MISAADKKTLKALLGKRSKAELTELFALVRAQSDRALLAAIIPPRKRAAKKRGDPIVRDVEQSLRPLMARSAEKGDLLIEHLAKKHQRPLPASSRGLADAVRRLRAAKLSDAQIRAGAKALIAELSKLYDGRETVV